MTMTPVARTHVVRQLQDLGVRRGGVLLAHASFSRTGPVEGGPAGLVSALQEAIGPQGTLVMPSMSSDDEHPFDPRATPCPDMGITAACAADSPHASPPRHAITAPHPIDPPHGADSPVGRARDHDAQVLLLGVGHDADTTIHLAENEAGVRYRRAVHVTVLDGGRPVRFDYREIDHCCARFALVDDWLEAAGRQRRGAVGHGVARLARARDIVGVVGARLREKETVFLHPRGFDTECDDAWSSLADLPVS